GAIDQATTNNHLEQRKSSRVTTIQPIQPHTIKKSSAKQTIDDTPNPKKPPIHNNTHPTQQDKHLPKPKVHLQPPKAKTPIHQAT
ncbi:DUF1542 domain-containing protein, partial [Staphylococcus haemolyticus]|uniref:DUF1542 domain-containing protein n=1 Tax=Staphylococcus haemolyticus TaxID=1283 RepID=UPI0011A6C86A